MLQGQHLHSRFRARSLPCLRVRCLEVLELLCTHVQAETLRLELLMLAAL